MWVRGGVIQEKVTPIRIEVFYQSEDFSIDLKQVDTTHDVTHWYPEHKTEHIQCFCSSTALAQFGSV